VARAQTLCSPSRPFRPNPSSPKPLPDNWILEGGAILKWTDDKSEDRGLTVWHVAEKNTEWFSPSPSSFMINYRIDNMSEMVADLKRNGVEIWKGPESHENGKFA
jgi:hypothetical protein